MVLLANTPFVLSSSPRHITEHGLHVRAWSTIRCSALSNGHRSMLCSLLFLRAYGRKKCETQTHAAYLEPWIDERPSCVLRKLSLCFTKQVMKIWHKSRLNHPCYTLNKRLNVWKCKKTMTIVSFSVDVERSTKACVLFLIQCWFWFENHRVHLVEVSEGSRHEPWQRRSYLLHAAFVMWVSHQWANNQWDIDNQFLT